MRFRSILPTSAVVLAVITTATAVAADNMNFGIAIHGGAGTIPRANMTPEREAAYRQGLQQALDAGYAVLEKTGSSLDAVNTAVRLLEDNELFNAGRGAVFNRAGQVELDAAIMDGSTLAAGAVACVKHVRNPIDLARRVMEKSKHVMLVGEGAEEFARQQGLTLVPNEYFYTERRRQQLEKALAAERDKTAADIDIGYFGPLGTVGAVALDKQGNLAAATSTGGLTAKLPGRVGDSPIIGAGTYAANGVVAVSATGHGELFIRNAVAHDVYALMAYQKMPLKEATHEVVQNKLKAQNAEGGIVTIDARGNISLEFNSEGMFRGARNSKGLNQVAIYVE